MLAATPPGHRFLKICRFLNLLMILLKNLFTFSKQKKEKREDEN